MSSDNPPYPYYNGIPFNPSFFTSDSGSGLSEAQANAKYLRKTVPDTASALETFNGGIITPSLSSTQSLNIVMPNALATDVLNVGVVSRNISGQVHHYSDGDNCVAGAGVHINNGINNASTTNIMNGTTTTGQVNIMTGVSSTGTTTIGTTGTSIGLNGTTTITGTANINTSSGLNTTIGTVNSGTTTLRGATISLNNTTTVNINTNPPSDLTKAVNIGGVNGANTTLTSIYGRLTTTGVTNINTTGTANTSIGVSGSTTAILGTTNINVSGTALTSIGNAGSTTAILGTTNINTIAPIDNLRTTTIGATSGLFDTNIALNGKTTISKLTTNSITSTADFSITPPITDDIILQPTASSSGKIDIMTGSNSTGSVNILTGAFASGIIDIGGESVTTSINGATINIAHTDDNSNTINILTGLDAVGDANVMTGAGNASTLTVGNTDTTVGINGVVNINTVAPTDNLKTTTIGATSGVFNTNTTISGKTTINKLTLNAPITSAYTVVPITGQLGFLPTPIFNAGDASLYPENQPVPGFTTQSVAKIELTAGTWILTGSFEALANANAGYVVCAITSVQNIFTVTTDYYVQSANSTTLNLNFLAVSIIQVTATQFYYLSCRTSVSPALPADRQVIRYYKLRATRMA